MKDPSFVVKQGLINDLVIELLINLIVVRVEIHDHIIGSRMEVHYSAINGV